jgi:hypothetical protein
MAEPVNFRDGTVASYLSRYVAGDFSGVWAELRALGRIPNALAKDCAAVAAETM